MQKISRLTCKSFHLQINRDGNTAKKNDQKAYYKHDLACAYQYSYIDMQISCILSHKFNPSKHIQ